MTITSYESMFYDALKIRRVEERIIQMYPTDLIQSPVHLSIGQEAVAVGVVNGLQNDDLLFINYRGHAYYLARNASLPAFFAELMGRKTGLSKGKAGSMHLAAPQQGIMGASAVVASTISHAVGAALAAKIKKENRVFVAIIGDGALEQGVFHETLNFSALHGLPVLFLCEDNGLAVHSPISERQSFNVKALVEAYGVNYFDCEDGYDFTEVANLTRSVRSHILDTNSPAFLRVKTMRYNEHVGPGDDHEQDFRDQKVLQQWKQNDPLIIEKSLLERFDGQIKKEIDDAVQFSLNSPYPTEEDLLTDVI